MSDVTRILRAIDHGDAGASERLLPLVYAELRTLAQARLANERPGQTLQPTALVHEAYLRLIGDEAPPWNSRGHFFGAAAEAMRRILIERARAKGAIKRGGDWRRIDVELADLSLDAPPDGLLELDEALERFKAESPEKARLVELRFFAGLTIEEAAAALGISTASATRCWSYARAWLYQDLSNRQST